MTSKVFIFGATGYIGKNLLPRLLDSYEVVTIGRNGCDLSFCLENDESKDLINSVKTGDCFIFLASLSSPDYCEKNFAHAKIINVEKTIKLIKELVKKKVKVIFSSSDAVFGAASTQVNDTDTLAPKGSYGEMKAEVEKYFSLEKFVKIVRFSYVFGENDKFTVMLKEEMNRHNNVQIFSGFERSVVALSDVLTGLINIISNWSNIESPINFSGPELISREKMVSELEKNYLIGLKYIVTEAPDGFWNSRSRTINTNYERFEVLLGKTPLTIKQAIENWRN